MIRIAAELADEWNLTGWRQVKHLTVTLRRLYQRVASTRRSEAWREDVDAFLAKCEELLAKAEATRASLLERAPCRRRSRNSTGTSRIRSARSTDGPEDPAEGGDPPRRRRSFRSSRNIRGGTARGRRASPWNWAFPSRSSRTSTSSSSSTGSCGGERHRCRGSRHRGHAGALPGTRRLQFRPRLSQPAKPGRPRRHAGTQRHARQGPPARQPPRTRGAAGLRTGRQQHPAVESAINNLEQRGLDRVRTHGKAGFARTVALSILAANVLRVGFLIAHGNAHDSSSCNEKLPDVAGKPRQRSPDRAAGGSPCPILPEITNMGPKSRPPAVYPKCR